MQDKEIAERFGKDFMLERVQKGVGRWMANWYTLRRRAEDLRIRKAGT
jgi:hypothetical protein